jgi:hypothetical protein
MSNTTLVGLMPIPEGVTADFNIRHMTETQRSFILAYSVTLGLATLTLGTRLYTRFFIVRSFGLDDSKCSGNQLLKDSNILHSCRIAGHGTSESRDRHQWQQTNP